MIQLSDFLVVATAGLAAPGRTTSQGILWIGQLQRWISAGKIEETLYGLKTATPNGDTFHATTSQFPIKTAFFLDEEFDSMKCSDS